MVPKTCSDIIPGANAAVRDIVADQWADQFVPILYADLYFCDFCDFDDFLESTTCVFSIRL